MSKERDMTVGRPLPILLSFILPLLLGLLFQQFYSMVDTVVVGKSLGVEALAGVGSTGSISFLIVGLCTGICSGFAIPVAQKFGERDEGRSAPLRRQHGLAGQPDRPRHDPAHDARLPLDPDRDEHAQGHVFPMLMTIFF